MRLIDVAYTYIEQYLKTHELYSSYGKVISVTDEWCEVELEGKANVNVRIYFKEGDFSLIPAEGSKCIVTFLSPSEAFLSMVEKIQKICVNSENEIIFNNGKNGGLVKSSSIEQKLNMIIRDLNNLKTYLKSAPVVAGDGGASFKASLLPWASITLNSVSKTDFENDKIKH